MRIATLGFVVLLLLGLGYFAGLVLTTSDRGSWDSGQVYAIWCIAAEASPVRADGTFWDEDGSPPDLCAEVTWRGNRVLKSSTSRNTLLASWDRSSVQLMDLLRTEFRPGDFDKIARIKAEPSESILVEIFDRDIFGSELVGSAEVPVRRLKHGTNRVEIISQESGLRSVSLHVVPIEILEAGDQTPSGVHLLPLALDPATP